MYILMIVIAIMCLLVIFGFNFLNLKNVNHNVIPFFDFSEKFYKIFRITASICLLLLYFGIRWAPSLANIIQYDLFNASATEFRSANLSIFFMLDWCSMMGWLLPFLCIVDWKNKYLLKPVAMLSMIGGLATIFFTTPELYVQWDVKKFFIGTLDIGRADGDEPLMFFMHIWMTIIGFNILVKNNYFNRFNSIVTFAILIIYISYIASVGYSLDIKSHVTGIVQGDVNKLNESYYIFEGIKYNNIPSYGLLEIFNLDWQPSSALLWIGISLIIISSISLKNLSTYLINNKYLKYHFNPY